MIAAIIALATSALNIWGTKLARKYLDELTDLEGKHREALNVEYRLRDHALIDDLDFRMQQCLRNIAADYGKPDPVA